MPFVFVAFTKVVNNWKGIMRYAIPGNTGLLVSKLCLGTMTFGDGRGLFNAISTGDDELVRTSIDAGGTS
jgi:aryl-alcohol dehydrogenase-like predicted oxidoreductase